MALASRPFQSGLFMYRRDDFAEQDPFYGLLRQTIAVVGIVQVYIVL